MRTHAPPCYDLIPGDASDISLACSRATETLVVARGDALSDSIATLAPYGDAAMHDGAGCLLLRPYFRSVFGRKTKVGSGGEDGTDADCWNDEGEAGLEEGEGRGPLLEYFGLVGAQMQQEGTAEVFAYHQGTEALWFGSKAAAEPEADADAEAAVVERWSTVGVILGSALCSRCAGALGLNLSPLLVRLLLLPPQPQPRPQPLVDVATNTADGGTCSSVADLMALTEPLDDTAAGQSDEQAATDEIGHMSSRSSALVQLSSATDALSLLDAFDPSMATMAKRVLDMSDTDFAELLELEDLGLDDHSRDDYVIRIAYRVVLEPVVLPLEALRQGFQRAVQHTWLSQLAVTPTELTDLLRGTESSSTAGGNSSGGGSVHVCRDFSWREVFRVVEDEELLGIDCDLLRRAFWRMMEVELSPAEKRSVLEFITGVGKYSTQAVYKPSGDLIDMQGCC